MSRKRRYTRAGPGRPSEYGEPLRLLSMNVPESKFYEFDTMCKTLGISRPKGFVFLMEHKNQNVIELMTKIEQLEKALAKKDEQITILLKDNERKDKKIIKLVEELEKKDKLIEKLRLQLKKANMSSSERKELELKQEIHAILNKYGPELTLVELFKRLGETAMGDALIHKVKIFLENYFKQNGKFYASMDLGLIVEPSTKVGILGWKVKKIGGG